MVCGVWCMVCEMRGVQRCAVYCVACGVLCCLVAAGCSRSDSKTVFAQSFLIWAPGIRAVR